jgi:CRISPR/Cas system-associated exonuclease Cas4 (RecB family)
MNRKELIQKLQAKGISQIYGRSLSRCLKSEIERYYYNLEKTGIGESISFSQINMYLKCGLQYFYRYRMGLKLPPSGALAFGISFEKPVDHNYKEKIITGADEPASTLTDLFVDEWRKQKERADFDENEKPEEMEKTGIKLVDVFRTKAAPNRQPMVVQKWVEQGFANTDYVLKAKIDLITIYGKIIDNKTAGKSKTQEEADNDLQLTLYALTEGLVEVGFDTFVKTKVPQFQPLSAIRTPEQKQRALAIIARVIEGMRSNIFVPAMPGTWQCTQKWCGYYDLCHKDLK